MVRVQIEFVLVIISANPCPSIQVFFKEIQLPHFYLSLWLTTFSDKTDDSQGLKTHGENPEENLPDLYFANDIVLLDETDIAAAEHYDNLQISASQVGLRFNKDKTKIMHINYYREATPQKTLEGLESVEDFKYLGARITLSFSDFRQRRGIAWSNFWKLHTIWRSNS